MFLYKIENTLKDLGHVELQNADHFIFIEFPTRGLFNDKPLQRQHTRCCLDNLNIVIGMVNETPSNNVIM